jgi:hypothetical protein
MSPENVNIKTVPIGFAMMAIIALWGAIEHPELPILWWVFGICASIAGGLYLLWLWAHKYIADTNMKTERIRSNRARQQAKHREKQMQRKAALESDKTNREVLRYQRAHLNKQKNVFDNAAKFIRERF